MAGLVGTMPRRQLARRLRELRERAGLTIDVAAKKLETSSSRLSRIENAEQHIDVHWLRAMLDIYGLTIDEWEPYESLCRQAAMRGWWRDFGLSDRGYVPLEAAAYRVRDFQATLVPGLLQTADYARSLFAAAAIPWPEEQREREIQVRMIRQRRLYAEDDPIELHAILDEAVLHRVVGGQRAHRAQLAQLVIAAELDTVTIQVVPFGIGARPGMDGAFSVLSFPDPDEPDVAYVEYMTGALHIDKAERVQRCIVTFEQLRSLALSPADSIALVERLIGSI
jgi:transcriptional regulator with XRE-family HTH domain